MIHWWSHNVSLCGSKDKPETGEVTCVACLMLAAFQRRATGVIPGSNPVTLSATSIGGDETVYFTLLLVGAWKHNGPS